MTNGQVSNDFEALLEYLQRTRGFDFAAYKPASLQRRILKRMQTVGIASVADYMDYLEVHPEEFVDLFNTILINVTGFFRDPEAWNAVRDNVLPRIIANRAERDPLRLWSAGCASGEEAYTLAMMMSEALGKDQYRQRVKIYATDVDDEALNQARLASYSAKQVEGLPPEYLERYFEHVNDRYVFNKDMRRTVIFGRNDLIQDAPISKVDLLACRNTLMYFNAEAQSRILQRFAFALNDNGYLFLGKAEMLVSRSGTFVPADMKWRIFMRSGKGARRERLSNQDADTNGFGDQAHSADLTLVAVEKDPVAQFIVDVNGTLVLINESARMLFGLTPLDLNRPLQDLQLSYRPVELRSLIEQALSERRTIIIKDVEWTHPGGVLRYLDVSVLPLFDLSGRALGATMRYNDVTRYRRLQEDLQQSHFELETANEELQSANEELETTNEELQSTIEELETTNEELQSTNEELETMNEELQSTNEELEAANEQLHHRSDEVDHLNVFLQSVLSSMRDGLVVVDHNMTVLEWNPRAEDLWGLRAGEARNKHLLNLDIGLPFEELRQPIRACLSGGAKVQELTVDATNRRGKPIRVKVTCSPFALQDSERQGAIVLMSEKQEDGRPSSA